MKILGISGSLRPDSWNTRLLRAAGEHLPRGVEFEIHGLEDVPLFRSDIDTDGRRPPGVTELRRRIAGADAVLYAAPEYNHSITGVLKNALDWASRPAFKSCLAGKRSGVVSAAPGGVGGARAQAHMKQILASCLSPVYPSPEYLLGAASSRFDGEGRLTDPESIGRLRRYLEGFVAWVEAAR